MNYYSRYPGHYLAATVHLTMEQDGAYNRLLDWCYSNESGIPHDKRYSIGRAQKTSEKRAINDVLSEFFFLEKDVWIQNRVVEEIEKSSPRIEAARNNGLRGGRPRKEKPAGLFNRNPEGFSNETQKEPSTKAPQSPIKAIDQKQSSLSSKNAKPKKPKPDMDAFAAVWSAYPRKVSKGSAEKAWVKLCPAPDLIAAIHAAVIAQARSFKWQAEPQYIPHLATWLNAKRWEDEVERAPPPAPTGKGPPPDTTRQAYRKPDPNAPAEDLFHGNKQDRLKAHETVRDIARKLRMPTDD